MIVKHFLQAGADPHVRNDHGDSALDLARERGQEKIIALLSNVNGLSELDLDVNLDLEDWESSSSGTEPLVSLQQLFEHALIP